MSLDITILGTHGSPKNQVSLGVDDHHHLMDLIGGSGSSLLARLKEYYADAEFENNELDSLIKEVDALRLECRKDDRLIPILEALVKLSEQAKLEKKPLIVIAD